jgi:hypothetical protein
MVNHSSQNKPGQKLSSAFREDLRHSGEIGRSLKQDFRELKEFYLDKEQKKRLSRMGWFKRTFFTTLWLFKILFLKLTPARRFLLLLSFILLLLSRTTTNTGSNNTPQMLVAGIVLILFILMLELKDKLLAKDELEAGRQVQNALHPKKNPSVPGWEIWLSSEPANDVGGDLIDFLPLAPTRFGIALGDIAGKGLSAALLSSKIQSTFRALLPDLKSLSDLAEKLNQIFYRDGLPKSFASMIYLELSPNIETIRFVNAGHMPPMIIRDRKLEELSKGQTALGILPREIYQEQIIDLNRNEIFVVYSDGATEARNVSGDFFGDQRFRTMLWNSRGVSAQELGVRIMNTVHKFVGDARMADDISLVILKRTT